MAKIMISFVVCLCLCAVDWSVRPMDNIIEMLNARDSKFGKHVSRDSPDMTPCKFFENGAWPWSRDP